jgi:hypothetical protein
VILSGITRFLFVFYSLSLVCEILTYIFLVGFSSKRIGKYLETSNHRIFLLKMRILLIIENPPFLYEIVTKITWDPEHSRSIIIHNETQYIPHSENKQEKHLMRDVKLDFTSIAAGSADGLLRIKIILNLDA